MRWSSPAVCAHCSPTSATAPRCEPRRTPRRAGCRGCGSGSQTSAWRDLRSLCRRRAAVRVEPLASIDRGMRLSTVAWSADDAIATIDADIAAAAYDWAVVATAAQLVGLAEAMLDMAVRYALQREQFGRVIGSFQAIK